MDEVLIVGHNSIREKTFKRVLIVLFSVVAIVGITLFVIPILYTEHDYVSGYEAAFSKDVLCLLLFILQCIVFISSIIVFLWSRANKNRELFITKTKVIARKSFGRETILPIHMISSISTAKMFSRIRVSTPSQRIKFNFLLDYRIISDVLANQLTLRQLKTQPTQNESQEYKSFFDNLSETDDDLL